MYKHTTTYYLDRLHITMNKKICSVLIACVVLPVAYGLDESCLVHSVSQRGYTGLDFQRKYTNNVSDVLVTKHKRDTSVYLQVVAYEDNKYGHYVSYSDNNQTRTYVNGSYESVTYESVYCVSSSFKPKELSQTWVKNFTGPSVFGELNTSESRTFLGSVTMKCYTPSCYTYNLSSGYYDVCGDVNSVDTISIKINFTVTPLNVGYSYDSFCMSDYTYRNGTHACEYPSLNAYSYSSTTLNATLNGIISNTKPVKVKTILHPRHLVQSYSYVSADAQLYSVCDGTCTALPDEL